MSIPKSLHDYYKGWPRPPTDNYSIYVTHPWDDALLSGIAARIGEASRNNGFSDYEKVNFPISFVQNLPYTSDSETSPFDEYPRFPLETLVDNGGDCEDTSILLAALLDTMGFDVVLLELPQHMAVGVSGDTSIAGNYYQYNGKRYYYVETTGMGWELGEIPEKYQGARASVQQLVPTPILTHSWTSKPSGANVELLVKVDNLGSAEATGVYVLAGFDTGNSSLWNSRQSQTFDLLAGNSVTVTLQLKPPVGKHTRVLVQLVHKGYAVDESHSDWFDT